MMIDDSRISSSLPARLMDGKQAPQAVSPCDSANDIVSLSGLEKAPRLVPDLSGIFRSASIEDKHESVAAQRLYITIAGCPGAGKTTQGKLLSERYGIPHISVGKILRKEVSDQTPLGELVKPFVEKGDLAPADLVARVVESRLSQPDCRNGFILDGFPRKMEDVESLEQIKKSLGFESLRMLYIDVNPEDVIKRVQNRRVCDNGHEYDLVEIPPARKGICDKDGLPLKQRDDDKPETIRHRFEIFNAETRPVLEYFKKSGEYEEVSGSGGIEDVQKRLADLLDPREKGPEAAPQENSRLHSIP